MPLQRAICQSTRNSRCYNVLCRCDKPGSRTYVLSLFSHVRLSVTLWTIARQAPLSMGFPRQEYWSGLPSPPAGDLPDPGIEQVLDRPHWQACSLPLVPPGKPRLVGPKLEQRLQAQRYNFPDSDIVSHFMRFFLFLHSLFCPVDLFIDLNTKATLILQVLIMSSFCFKNCFPLTLHFKTSIEMPFKVFCITHSYGKRGQRNG